MNAFEAVTALKGIGGKKAESYAKLNITNLEELVMYMPSGYKNRGKLKSFAGAIQGERLLTEAEFVKANKTQYIKKGFTKTVLTFKGDECGFTCVYYNIPYAGSNFKPGVRYRLYGSVGLNGKNLCLINPKAEKTEALRYLTEGVYAAYRIPAEVKIKEPEFSAAIKKALEVIELNEEMPLKLIVKADIKGKLESLKMLHFPGDEAEAEAGAKYFALEKFLMLRAENEKRGKTESDIKLDCDTVNDFISALPFELTNAQQNAINDIITDIKSKKRMNRLINGDVGCGKTAVCMASAYIAAKSGLQAAICAPTQVLIKQHYAKYSPLFESLNIKCALLTSELTGKKKQETLNEIKTGISQVVFGTHALFSADTEYKALALTVFDEQQRYGVRARASLEAKGILPHSLVMSATPIPRTLALSLLSDLDISVIDEIPQARHETKTFIVNRTHRHRLLALIRKKAEEGLKTYVVCPAIDSDDLKNVNETFDYLKQNLPGIGIVKLTGEMKPELAEAAMQKFTLNKASVLVATSVIEVGVDDQKAVIMWINGAERFGLSQLHQLRGRVGRGEYQSYCFLEPSEHVTVAPERLGIIKSSNDGFEIARRDLYLRGSGEIYGMNQSGFSDGTVNDILRFKELYELSEELYADLRASGSDTDNKYLALLKNKAELSFNGIAFN